MCLISSDHSLFINCGGEENITEGNVYDKDNDTSQFYRSPKGNWARSSAGSSIHTVRCGLSSESPLYNKARSSPVSLKYYGFCLRQGNYNVTLHFVEAVEDNNYTTDVKRVFHVYIQVINIFLSFVNCHQYSPSKCIDWYYCMVIDCCRVRGN